LLHPESSRNRLIGIGAASVAYLCFSVLDTSAKWLVQSLPVIQIVWLRFVVHMMVMLPLAAVGGGLRLDRVRRPGLQLVRAAMTLSMTGLNFWALRYLQLAETGSVQFAVPILVAVLAAWFLRERLDPGRWCAVVAGFAGVLLIMRPGTQAFHPAILLSIGNAVIYAAFTLLTRKLAATDPPELTNLLSPAGAVVALAPFALQAWQTPETPGQWAAILLTGIAGGFGHLLLARSVRYAPASAIAPFMYQQMLYMMLFGYLLFGDVPGPAVMSGAAVVVVSGLYLIWRERRPM
jgi:drug/metabolite transporter (DMT)-like permease